MLLKSVKYHNFRPFIGDQEVDLTPSSDSDDKNVVVIIGDNTFGKSTFVLSFIWCFYGESRFSRPNDILNKKVEAQMSFGQQEEASVEVSFEDGDIEYTMKRSQVFTMGQNGHLNSNDSTAILNWVTTNGETKRLGRFQNEVNETMRAILPKDLSSFFFFEGEKNNEIRKKDLGKSVKTLLGLEAFENMRQHLHGTTGNTASTSVMGYYQEKQKNVSGADAQKAYEDKIKAEGELKDIQDRITEIRSTIVSYEAKIDAINETLRQAAPSKELQRRRDAIKNELRQQEEELTRNNKKLVQIFSRDSMPLFITPFLSKISMRLKEMDVADKGIKGIEAPAIHELLHREICLCGTDLKPGTVAYKNVEKYIDFIPPKSVGTLVRDMTESIDGNSEKCERFVEDFEEAYKSIQRCKVKINDLEREEKEKLAEIAKIGNIDTSDAEANLSTYKSTISNLREELERKLSEEGSKKNDIDTAERRFNDSKSKNEKAAEYQLYFKYAEEIYNWVNENYTEKEKAMRKRLSDYVSDLFKNMYSGHRDVCIDDEYNINMTYNGTVVDDTGGLRVIQYFAYVGGLVKLAYEVMLEREKDDEGNIQTLGERYPLVLDAAFSHADQTHTKSIAKELATASKQLIFALMEKDWNYAKEGLAGKVGRKYELKKIDETEARIVEVN